MSSTVAMLTISSGRPKSHAAATAQLDLAKLTIGSTTSSADEVKLLVQGKSDDVAGTKQLDVQTSAGTSRFNVTTDGSVAMGSATSASGVVITGALSVSGNLTVTGTTSAVVTETVSGNLTIGDATTDTVEFISVVKTGTSIVPADDTVVLGSAAKRFANIYVADGSSTAGLRLGNSQNVTLFGSTSTGGLACATSAATVVGVALDLTSGTGGLATNGVVAGAGGACTDFGGTGGIAFAAVASNGGAGGARTAAGGVGGAGSASSAGGVGGTGIYRGGVGGASANNGIAVGNGGPVTLTGGASGAISNSATPGTGGLATVVGGTGVGIGSTGGAVTIQGGAGGTTHGTVAIATLRGVLTLGLTGNTTTVASALTVNEAFILGAGANPTFSQVGSGAFGTGTGAVSLNGDVTIAAAKNLTMSGAATLTSGTGAVTCQGDTTISGSKAFTTGTGAVTIKGAMTFDAGVNVAYASSSTGNVDLSNSSGTFLTPAGAVTIGSGAVAISGAVTMSAHKGILAAAGTGAFDFGVATGIFRSSTGTNTLMGDVTITGAKAFTTGTGAVTINGAVSVASGVDIVAAGGASDIDYSLSSGIFKTPTGENTLSGNVTISGSKAFTTGTGAVSLNGDVSVASGKNYSQAGAGTFGTGTGAVSLNGNVSVTGSLTFAVGTGLSQMGNELKLVGSAGVGAALRITANTAAPASAAGVGLIYTKAVGDHVELFYTDDDGSETQITLNGSLNIAESSATETSGGVTAQDIVYLSSGGKALPASAATYAQAIAVFGVVLATAADTVAVATAETHGAIISGFSGLTVGTTYYLSGSTPGAITATIPTATGHAVVRIGVARTTSTLLFVPQYLYEN